MSPFTTRAFVVRSLLAGLFAASAAAASAQPGRMAEPGQAQISATGHVHLQRTPTHLRMYLQISGKGKTLEEALAALKERREAVAAQLEKLGADKKSIVFAPPGSDDAGQVQQRRMEMMIAQRLSGRGAKKAAKPVKPPVSTISMLTVQWPLTGDSTEKLLLAADELREKVKAAELAGGKEAAPKLSAEEQEAAEEMAAEVSRSMGSDEEGAKPNEPHFVFVARLSAADRQKALADSFAKAKTQAAELAKAAGAEMGPLTGISGEGSGGFANSRGYMRSPYGGYMRNDEGEYLQQLAPNDEDDQRTESIALKPDGIGFDFVVNATFALRQ